MHDSANQPAPLRDLFEAAGATVLGTDPVAVSFGARHRDAVLAVVTQQHLILESLSHTKALCFAVSNQGPALAARLLTQATAGDASIAIARIALERPPTRTAAPAHAFSMPVPLDESTPSAAASVRAVLATALLDRQAFATRMTPTNHLEHTLSVLLLDSTHLDAMTPLRDGIAYAIALAASDALIETARLLNH